MKPLKPSSPGEEVKEFLLSWPGLKGKENEQNRRDSQNSKYGATGRSDARLSSWRSETGRSEGIASGCAVYSPDRLAAVARKG